MITLSVNSSKSVNFPDFITAVNLQTIVSQREEIESLGTESYRL